MSPSGPLFLGLDSSTQSLSAVALDDSLNIVAAESINFDAELPSFQTEGGVHRGDDGLTVTSPTIMWVAALDLLLSRLHKSGFPFDRVYAISGSGQQHGSVYLRAGARGVLGMLNSDMPLRVQLADLFAIEDSPVWMDSSTSAQCAAREAALGGAQATADLTGSRAYERFTGNQIAKIYQSNPDGYNATERIQLVSSFVGSLLAGDPIPIDAADGSGMNMMSIREKTWSPAAVECTAPGLRDKLGPIVASHTVVGAAHPYYTTRYGLNPECKIVAFSGDNPCSLAGLRLQTAGDIAISLGTSDTIFASLSKPTPSASEGHVLANPVDPDGYMALICWKNGSLTRENIRDRATGGSWDDFSAALDATPAGNSGQIGFYIKEAEITPPILQTGTFRFCADGRAVAQFEPQADVRAVVEGQFLSMRLHCGNIGIHPRSILATGGASANLAIIRTMSNIFGAPVYSAEVTDAASLGAAYRARHGWICKHEGRFIPFAETMTAAPPFEQIATPDPDAHAVYSAMLPRYAELEKHVIEA